METTQLLKGVLDAAVLAIVQRADGYGYDVVRRLRDAGLEEVGDASVYGTLRRLYAAGALSTYVVPSDDGPHRKYYSITPAGVQLLKEQRLTWHKFSEVLSELIRPDGQNNDNDGGGDDDLGYGTGDADGNSDGNANIESAPSTTPIPTLISAAKGASA